MNLKRGQMKMIETAVTVISQVGFPIACVIAMAYFVIVLMKQHKEESAKMTEAINNNTILLQQILEHMRDNE